MHHAPPPYADADIGVNIAAAASFGGFISARSGSFIGPSARDGGKRYYAFMQAADLPLILNVALSTDEIEAEWRVKALVIGGIVLALCGFTVALTLLFGRELRHRATMRAELERLSLTDALTLLPNRWAFEQAGIWAWEQANRSGKPFPCSSWTPTTSSASTTATAIRSATRS